MEIPYDVLFEAYLRHRSYDYDRLMATVGFLGWGIYKWEKQKRLIRRLEERLSKLEAARMDITTIFIPIPLWNGRNGNFKKGRVYYNGPKTGHKAQVDKFIYHYINGNLALADAALSRPTRIASYHFAIEDTTVHQYVSLADTAFNCGKGEANCESIAISVSAQPGRDASDASYESFSVVVWQTAKALGKKVGDFQHLPHKHFSATACPGTLDIDRIVRRAMELEAADGNLLVAAPVHVPVKEEGRVTSSLGLKVRSTPEARKDNANWVKLANGERMTFAHGQGLWYVGTTFNDGLLWLILENNVGYVWSGATNYKPNQQVT